MPVCVCARVRVPVTGAGRQCMFECVCVFVGTHTACVSVLVHAGVHGCTCNVHVCHCLCVCCCMSPCCSRHLAWAMPSTLAPQHRRPWPQPPQAVRAVPGAGPRCPLDKTACPIPAEPPVPRQAGSLCCMWHSTQCVLPGDPTPGRLRAPSDHPVLCRSGGQGWQDTPEHDRQDGCTGPGYVAAVGGRRRWWELLGYKSPCWAPPWQSGSRYLCWGFICNAV